MLISEVLIITRPIFCIHFCPLEEALPSDKCEVLIAEALILSCLILCPQFYPLEPTFPNLPYITKYQPMWPQNCWLLRLLPSLNFRPISHLSQIPIPIFHPLWSKNCSFIESLPNLPYITNSHTILNPCPIYYLSQIPSPFSHLLLSQNFWLLRLLLPPLPNLSSITNSHPNIPSHVITKLMICWNWFYHPCPISHLSKISSLIYHPLWSQNFSLLRLILSVEIWEMRITLILTSIFLVWYTQICQGQATELAPDLSSDERGITEVVESQVVDFINDYANDEDEG